jgi:hypothetical protein
MNRTFQYGLYALLLATVLLVSACGIKPKDLSAPEGSDPNDFPRHYPQE